MAERQRRHSLDAEHSISTPGFGPLDRVRSRYEPASVADDRGMNRPARHSFSGDRESDELGSELDHDAGIVENSDSLDDVTPRG